MSEPITRPLKDRLLDYVKDVDHDELKGIMREAIIAAGKEWMDDNFKRVGKWTLSGIAVAAFGALTYFIMHFGDKP